jgi:hypothetical protein
MMGRPVLGLTQDKIDRSDRFSASNQRWPACCHQHDRAISGMSARVRAGRHRRTMKVLAVMLPTTSPQLLDTPRSRMSVAHRPMALRLRGPSAARQ